MQSFAVAQTFYRGTYYRSRIEARWAVFFDVLGIKHQYEPEKFELSMGRYIPDFYLENGFHRCVSGRTGAYWEVKGAEPDPHTIERFKEFKQLALDAYLCHGSINDYSILPLCEMTVFKDGALTLSIARDCVPRWVQCPFCGSFGLSDWHPQVPLQDFNCKESKAFRKLYDINDFFFYIDPPISPSIRIATSTAQSARFEDVQSIEKIVDAAKNNVQVLSSSQLFSDPRWTKVLLENCRSLQLNPECPRYWEVANVQ